MDGEIAKPIGLASRRCQTIKPRRLLRLLELLADDAVFHSPVLFKPQHGKALTRLYLSAAFQVLFNGSFRYVREIVGDRDAMLEFECEIDGIVINGVDLIGWDQSGRITDFKVMLRPLKAIMLVKDKMAAMLEAGA